MSNPSPKKSGLFSAIACRADALRTIKDGAIAFILIGILHILIGIWLLPGVIADDIFYVVVACIVWRWKSRVAAVLLALVAVSNVVVTFLNRVGVSNLGGGNVILAVIMAIVSIRVVEAAFKTCGRFKKEDEEPNKSAQTTAMTPPPSTTPPAPLSDL